LKFSIKSIGLFVGPILFIILSQLESETLSPSAVSVLAVAAWMVIWWISEATPMAVAALLPIILFPALGIFSLSEATTPYSSPIIFLFMGGFFLALGLEEHGLHRRIALNLVKLTGTSANGIIFGFMLATAFLSMWISNTASTIMMLPIAASITSLIRPSVTDKKGFKYFALSLMLGIAYSANIGGMATIIGTPPNVVFVGYAEQLLNMEIDFAKWLLIGVPISSVLLLITFLVLTQVLYRNNLGTIKAASELIDNEIKGMGVMSRKEKMVAIIFGLTASMWIFKQPLNTLFGESILNDTATAMIGGILMFAVPTNIWKGKFLLSWKASCANL
jgi:sodium-dependent dicarboxylate transporter 2/3/5